MKSSRPINFTGRTKFRYKTAVETDVGATIRRAIKERQQAAEADPEKVVPIRKVKP